MSIPSSDRSPAWADTRQRLVILSGLALLAFVLRVYRIDYQSLWRDEVDAVIFATRDLGATLAMFARVGENGPLYFLALHGWIKLVGQSEFAVRFPSAVFGVLAVLATYQLGRDVAGRNVGLIGALLLAVSPYHVWYAQEVKMYALISFLAPLSLLILLRAVRGARRWPWLAWALLMGVFLYIHLFAVMMILVAVAWLPFLLRRRPRLSPALLAALALITLAALPVLRWLLPAALTPVETGYARYSLGEMATILLYNFSMGLRPAAGLWPAALFALLLASGCAPLLRWRRWSGEGESGAWPPARAVLLLLLYLLVPLLAIWLVSLRRPTFTDRYLIIVLPAFYLLIASGIMVIGEVCRRMLARGSAAASSSARRGARSRRVVAVSEAHEDRRGGVLPIGQWFVIALTLAVVGVSLPFVWAQTHNPYKADFRAATRYVTERAAADDLIIFLMPYVQRGFAYYHPQPVRSVEPPYTLGMTAAQVDEKMRSLTAGSSTVWLYLSEQEFWDPDGQIPAWFERNAVRGCLSEYAYIEVRCYQMK